MIHKVQQVTEPYLCRDLRLCLGSLEPGKTSLLPRVHKRLRKSLLKPKPTVILHQLDPWASLSFPSVEVDRSLWMPVAISSVSATIWGAQC